MHAVHSIQMCLPLVFHSEVTAELPLILMSPKPAGGCNGCHWMPRWTLGAQLAYPMQSLNHCICNENKHFITKTDFFSLPTLFNASHCEQKCEYTTKMQRYI